MKINIPFINLLPHLLKPLKPLLRHHYFVLIMALLIMLIVAVYVVTQTLQSPTDEAYQTQKLKTTVTGNFDQATIDKIERLQRSSDQPGSQPVLPPGTRSNPFAE